MRKLFLLLFGLATTWGASAKVSLPEIIGSGMVLQQNASAKLWGWADARATVSVETSWGVKCSAQADNDGRWEVRVATPAGGYAPQRITIRSGERVELNDVLIGEVWFAGGQSNMEMPLRGFWNCPIEGSNEVIARADKLRDKIRYVRIPKTAAATPQERVAGAWREFSTATAPDCTATGYFFAELLNDALDVPVGVIDCSWGGSRVESWSDRTLLEQYADVDLTPEGIESMAHFLRPMVMYNGMLHPVAGYTIRGFIWYQGESNVTRYADYAPRLANMVALWRTLWGQGQLPFYFVEIAPYGYKEHKAAPYMREAQYRAQQMIPSSAMICTNDLAEPFEVSTVHPRHKRGVGQRLAFLALNKTYNRTGVACQSPRYRSMKVREGKVWIEMDHLDGGYNRITDILGFEICGPDSVFHSAQARMGEYDSDLVVWSERVAEPVAVRYGFRNFLPGNLTNVRGLPVFPFRTDDFPPEK